MPTFAEINMFTFLSYVPPSTKPNTNTPHLVTYLFIDCIDQSVFAYCTRTVVQVNGSQAALFYYSRNVHNT